MDINRALRLAISTGEVKLGKAQANKSMIGNQAKLLILANNCPKGMVGQAKNHKVPVYKFRGNNRELGAACGKPFSISTVTILAEGNSEILALRPAKKEPVAKVVEQPVVEPEPEPVTEEPEEEEGKALWEMEGSPKPEPYRWNEGEGEEGAPPTRVRPPDYMCYEPIGPDRGKRKRGRGVFEGMEFREMPSQLPDEPANILDSSDMQPPTHPVPPEQLED